MLINNFFNADENKTTDNFIGEIYMNKNVNANAKKNTNDFMEEMNMRKNNNAMTETLVLEPKAVRGIARRILVEVMDADSPIHSSGINLDEETLERLRKYAGMNDKQIMELAEKEGIFMF